MPGRIARRWASRACLAGALVALGFAALPARASAQAAPAPPRIFQADAGAVGLDLFPDRRRGLTPVTDATHVQFTLGTSRIDATRGPAARSGVLDPGAGVVKGPALVCSEVAGQAFSQMPPAFGDLAAPLIAACTQTTWPFLAESDSLTAADTSTAGAVSFGAPSSPVSGEGGGARAHLDDYDSSTDASLGATRVGGVPGAGGTGLPVPGAIPPLPGSADPGADPGADPALVSVASVQSTTRSFLDGSTAVAQATSTANGVRLLGGLVTFDSVTSTAESRSSPGQPPVGSSTTVVQGLRVLGQVAEIGPDGLRSGDASSGGVDAVNDALSQALSGAGLTVRLEDAAQATDEAGAMTATAGGVVVELNRTLDLPNGLSDEYFVDLHVASVSARALAYDIEAGSTAPPPAGAASTNPFVPTPAGTVSGSSGGTSVGAAAPAPVAPPPVAAAPGIQRTALLGIDPGRIRFLYLSFTLTALGLCLAPRLSVPSRLPRLSGS